MKKIEEIRKKYSIKVNSEKEHVKVISYLKSLGEITTTLTFHETWNKICFYEANGNWQLLSSDFKSYNLPSITFSDLKHILGDKTKEKWIPEVGDWVVRLNDSHLGIKVDQVCQIYEFDTNCNQPRLTGQNNKSGSHAICNLRKALPHEIPVNQSNEFVLPEKWCIKDGLDSSVFKYFNVYNCSGNYSGTTTRLFHYPKISTTCLFSEIQKGYTEITLDQFKKYVLKENNKVKPINMSKEELLEEAKRRFPIGTKFKAPDNKHEYTVKKFDKVLSNYWLQDNYVIVSIEERTSIGAYLYKDGQWAEIVEPVKPEYKCNPFPTDRNYLKLRVVQDIVEKSFSSRSEEFGIIPKGSITWVYSEGYKDNLTTGGCIHIEGNKYHLNFQNTYFALIEEVINEGKSEEPVKVSMEDIQKQCKEKYPIGCTFKDASIWSSTSILTQDSETYKINDNTIYAGSNQGLLYKKGKWAELISLPEQNKEKPMKTQFEKGDYIVILDVTTSLSFPKNFIFKQKTDSIILLVGKDAEGDINGWSSVKFTDSKYQWRYATSEEVKEYERLGKPYNVTTLQSKPTETLLEKGKRLYPIGTKYNPLDCNGDTYMKSYAVIRHVENETGLDFGYGYVYVKSLDKWAEIIPEEPVEQVNPVSNNLVKHGVELIPGEYYYYKTTSKYLFEHKGGRHVRNEINLNTKRFIGDDQWSFDYNTLRKATPEEISHVKQCVAAGKYVEPQSKNTNNTTMTPKEHAELALARLLKEGFKKGCTYKCVDTGNEYVATGDLEIHEGNMSMYYIDCGVGYLWRFIEPDKFATLVSPASASSNTRLKVGDIVKITVPYSGCPSLLLNDECEIIEVDNSNIPYRVKRLSDNKIGWVKDVELSSKTYVLAAYKNLTIGDEEEGFKFIMGMDPYERTERVEQIKPILIDVPRI